MTPTGAPRDRHRIPTDQTRCGIVAARCRTRQRGRPISRTGARHAHTCRSHRQPRAYRLGRRPVRLGADHRRAPGRCPPRRRRGRPAHAKMPALQRTSLSCRPRAAEPRHETIIRCAPASSAVPGARAPPPRSRSRCPLPRTVSSTGSASAGSAESVHRQSGRLAVSGAPTPRYPRLLGERTPRGLAVGLRNGRRFPRAPAEPRGGI